MRSQMTVNGCPVLKSQCCLFSRKVKEFTSLETNLHALEREIDVLFKHTVATEESSNHALRYTGKNTHTDKLVETKKTFSVKMMQLSATQRYVFARSPNYDKLLNCHF